MPGENTALDKYRKLVKPAGGESGERPAPPELKPVQIADDSDGEEEFYQWAKNPSYQAMWVANRPVRQMHICPVGEVWDTLPYRYFLHMPEDGGRGTRLILMYTFMAITVTGSNLQSVAAAIRQERCVAIRAFNSKLHDLTAADPSAPVIEKITFGMDKKIEAAIQLAMAEVRS